MFDSLIKNGTGNVRYKGNIGIKDGKIKYIGECIKDAIETIDAEGFIILTNGLDNSLYPKG